MTTYSDNTTESATYDADGRRATRFAYDGVGRPTRTTFVDGPFTETVFDLGGRVTASKDALGNATTHG